MHERLRAVLLAAIVAIYVALGAAYAIKTPTWQTPDEPAHFNYVRDLAEQAQFPVLQTGDYDQAYLEKLKASKFPPDLPVDSIRYESWQPPMYYVLAAPLYLASRGLPLAQQVIVVRLFSVFLGAILLIAAYGMARCIFPKDDLLSLAVPGFIAVLPQHIAMTAAVSNDTLAEVVIALILLLLVRRLNDAEESSSPGPTLGAPGQGNHAPTTNTVVAGFTPAGAGQPGAGQPPFPPPGAPIKGATTTASQPLSPLGAVGVPLVAATDPTTILLGVLLGVALLTKTTIYIGAALIPLGLLLREYRLNGWRIHLGSLARQLALVFGIALVLSGWWFARNALVYGGLDVLGWQRHDLVVQGQPLTGAFDLAYAKFFAATAFKSFWAQFGWMGVLADERTYTLLGVLTAAGVAGLGLFIMRVIVRPDSLTRFQRLSLLIMGAAFVLVAVALVSYNLRFIQAQGRYLFPALLPIAVFFTLGLREIVAHRYAPLLFIALYLALLALDYVSLARFILPQLTG